ncbi:translocation/assembly module TamB domain-containing protein [Otariodibacter oris]|uniref:Autotransporter secretion inner membrane protein TamB n=1 Tax=Otariodibacter oris TaxID=1032623 RepID=A0A420XFS5_9PAST|nr:translocation/assembly module TamB domain-containing protein [Otariodibacter oris]QGM80251.1 tubulin-binding protein [Otariodibacter oris]RKR71616.1 autotransporter secretion inner membrane protein TamB [Otariodibacter oris]
MKEDTIPQEREDVSSKNVSSEKIDKKIKSKKKNKWRCCRWIMFFLFIIVLVPIVVLSTGAGQRFALELVSKSLDQLEIGEVSGSLQDGLILTDTKFITDGVQVNIGEAQAHIGFSCLLEGKACIENISLADANIVIDTSKLPKSEQPKEENNGNLELPAIALKRVALDNISLKVDEMDMRLSHFESGMEGQGKDLSILPTELSGLSLSLPPQAVSSEEENVKVERENIDWAELEKTLSQPLLTKLDPIKLPLNFDIPSFKITDVSLSRKVKNDKGDFIEPLSLINIHSADLVAKSDTQSVELKQLEIKTDKGDVIGEGKLTLQDNYPLDWNLQGISPQLEFGTTIIPASKVSAKLNGELFGETVLDIDTSGAVDVNVQGSVKLAEPKTPLDLHIVSSQIQYPFIAKKEDKPLLIKDLDLLLSGDLLNYQLETSVGLEGMNIPTGQINVNGKGELTKFELNQLSLNALEGQANLSGRLDWSNGIEWQSQVNLDKVNTKSILPEWAAILSGALTSSGYSSRGQYGEQWNVSVSDIDLHGNLFQKNLRLTGDITASDSTLLDVSQAQLIYGDNNIAMQGILGEESDFSAEIHAPNLQGLIPNLGANIDGNVILKGKISAPTLDIDLNAKNLNYNQINLNNLVAKGQVSTDEMIRGDIDITLGQFEQGEIKFSDAHLKVSGTEKAHTLSLTSKGNPVGGNLQLSGNFERSSQVWDGQLSNVQLNTPIGELRNDQSVQITYDNNQIDANISAHCWQSTELNLCFPESFKVGKSGKVPFEIKQLNLALAQQYLDKNSKISGIVSAKGDAAWSEEQPVAVNVELLSDAINFSQNLDGKNFPINLKPVKVVANLANNNLQLSTDISLEKGGRLVSDVIMDDIVNTRTLSGNINIDGLTLDLIKPFLSNGEVIQGDINARLTLGGNALSPLLYGTLDLTELKARAEIMPFDVVGGNLALRFDGSQSSLTGNLQTPDSKLTLDGDANWQQLDAWYTRIHANAERFKLDIPNIAKVQVSPDIEVKVTPQELLLTGNIDIPWARIAIKELPESAVSVSDDEVIMEGRSIDKDRNAILSKQLPSNAGGMSINANISINIGNDVKLDAYGLQTDLYGVLKVQQGNRGLGLYGQVNLKDGQFSSFGQDLLIRKGLISFTGLPSQPTLDIEAIRNPEAMEDPNVTAGVKVTGIADLPEVKVFSNPSMGQDQALSYLLTGRGLDSDESGSGNSIAGALIGVGLSQGSQTVGDVGSAFGISDLSVSTAGIGDNTKVVVSGSLTPKFKVKYGVGIFAPLTELTLRYRLAPSLYLQFISSINQAVDLLYQFEFD